MESSEEAETRAKRELQRLIDAGKAEAVLTTYYFCNTSCDFVYDELQHVAYEADSGISPEVVNFARNLLDDWCK